MQEHLKHVTEVPNVLRQHQLHAKKNKCAFNQLQVEYLGHIISIEGIEADPRKVESMMKWLKPENVK